MPKQNKHQKIVTKLARMFVEGITVVTEATGKFSAILVKGVDDAITSKMSAAEVWSGVVVEIHGMNLPADERRSKLAYLSQSGRMLAEGTVPDEDWEDHLIFRAG